MTPKLNLNRSTRWDFPSIFALSLAIVLGAFVRLFRVLPADFPLNDGGLFRTMIQELLASRFALPVYTAYNSANIPFAYPPLPFYAAALLVRLTGWSELEVLRLLPPFISILTIPAFYLLARTLLRSRAQAGFAALAFALLPRSFVWLVMGGGLTRSMGLLWGLLTVYQAYLMYTRRQKRFIFSAAVCAALTVLSHPEGALFATYSAAILFLFYARSRQGLLSSALVVLGALSLSAPWWATIVARHGLRPFLSALQTGGHASYAWMSPFVSRFTEEPFLDLFAALGLLGVFACVADRRFLFPLWVLTTFIMDPRSASTYATLPLALTIGIAIDRLVLPGMRKPGVADAAGSASGLKRRLDRYLSNAVLAFLLVYALWSALGAQMTQWTPLCALRKEEREAMRWVAANTDPASKFAVLTLPLGWARNATAEWFPSLAERVSVATVQGCEWLPNHEFDRRLEEYDELVAECAIADLECLEAWSQRTGRSFTHVYISAPTVLPGEEKPRDCCACLRDALLASPRYVMVYDGPGATIFARRF